MSRPELNNSISIEDFKNYYWLKEELQNFCRQNNIPTRGGKIEIAKRIEEFLTTGKVSKVTTLKISNKKEFKTEELSLDTIITADYRNSEAHRAFFKSVIGENFKFNVKFMNFFKENVGKTYKDAVDEYHRIEKLKKDPEYKTNIDSQFQYNQYFRDFFADPKNKDKTRKDAIASWNERKKQPGELKYNGN